MSSNQLHKGMCLLVVNWKQELFEVELRYKLGSVVTNLQLLKNQMKDSQNIQIKNVLCRSKTKFLIGINNFLLKLVLDTQCFYCVYLVFSLLIWSFYPINLLITSNHIFICCGYRDCPFISFIKK